MVIKVKTLTKGGFYCANRFVTFANLKNKWN